MQALNGFPSRLQISWITLRPDMAAGGRPPPGSERGVRHVSAYASAMYFRKRDDLPAALAYEAAQYASQGFGGVKMKIGLSLREDVANVAAVRERIGDDMLLMVDANHAYDPDAAIRTARELDRYSITWFEEPVSPDDLARGLRVPERLRFGSVSVNGPKYEVYLPHGGTKESGIGKDCSHLSLDEYYYVKRISVRLPESD